MSYKKSKHYNAVLKYVKQKGITLQKDAADIMNGSIQTAVRQLEEDGKIKRVKIKVRFKNGNLNDSWCLYLPNTNYNEVLEFEKKYVNRPYSSPLKEHHCYKKDKSPTVRKTSSKSTEDAFRVTISDSENTNNSNVIEMQDYVKVNDQDVKIKDYNGMRTVTLNDVDSVHQRPKGTARANFNRNKEHLVHGEDYFELTGEELSRVRLTYAVHKNTTKLTILTESGYLLLVKTFTDPLSWKVQKQLVNSYFKVKELKQDPSTQNVPAVQNYQQLDVMEMMIKEMKNQNNRIDQLEQVIYNIADALPKR